jgi:hypothetical protein
MTLVFLLSGVFLLIPSYPYTMAFFYVSLGIFFMFTNGREQRDGEYCALLPIRKRDAVRGACLYTAIIELLAMLLAVPFALFSSRINPVGGNPAGLNANVVLFAAGFVLFTLFNAVFLPGFYKTGYKTGVPFLKANIAMALLVLCDVILPHVPGLAWLDGTDAHACLRQLPLLASGAVIYGAGLWLTCRRAEQRYQRVDL